MKKILLILTGGTICSFADSLGINRDVNSDKAERLILDNFRKSGSLNRKQGFDVEVVLDILSENMTVSDWNIIIEYMKNINVSNYKGIIFTHGTDTLAYTSSMLSLVLSNINIPVFIVASNLPLDNKMANGNINFQFAVDLICNGINPGVYVLYRNTDNRVYLHRASHINQCNDYSNDFYSADGYVINSPDDFNGIKRNKGSDSIELRDLNKIKGDVLYVNPYIGIDYSKFDIEGIRAVVHRLYHSGTGCVINKNEKKNRNSILYFVIKCVKKGIPFFITPCKAQNNDYITSEIMIDSGAIPIYGMTSEMVYVKTVISGGLDYYSDPQMIKTFLMKNIAGEFIY